MNPTFRISLAIAVAAATSQAIAQVTFYEREGFDGRAYTTHQSLGDFARSGFNDRASSAVVQHDRWEVCEDAGFSGRCVVLKTGNYPSLAAMGLNDRVSSARRIANNVRLGHERYAPAPMGGQISFYEHDRFEGRSFTTEKQVGNFERYGFNDRASSAVVVGQPWEVCDDAGFAGRCVVLRPGRYPSLASMGLNDRVSSVRTVRVDVRIDDRRYGPAPMPVYDSRRRGGERLYEANVTSVRAVLGTPERRCWVEREQVSQQRDGVNVPAAIAGAVIGGILGHQVGGGRGKDVATAGGAIAGAAVGANIGRDGSGQQVATQDVQRCDSPPSQSRPDYWDVSYNFRGQDHRVQMSAAPGPTVVVNERGEPRT